MKGEGYTVEKEVGRSGVEAMEKEEMKESEDAPLSSTRVASLADFLFSFTTSRTHRISMDASAAHEAVSLSSLRRNRPMLIRSSPLLLSSSSLPRSLTRKSTGSTTPSPFSRSFPCVFLIIATT